MLGHIEDKSVSRHLRRSRLGAHFLFFFSIFLFGWYAQKTDDTFLHIAQTEKSEKNDKNRLVFLDITACVCYTVYAIFKSVQRCRQD